MMGDQTLGKLTASLEELSLKKQLPLRQQVQKPMLKYNNNVIKPVQLFNHADLASIRSTVENRNTFSSLSQSSSNSSVSTTPFRSAKPSAEIQLNSSTMPVPASSNASTKTSPTKGHSNPYARPLSAKDIVSDIHNRQVKKTPSLSQMGPNGNNMMANNVSGTPMFGFQMNAFMRPQSALKREAPINPKSVAKTSSSNNQESTALKEANNASDGAETSSTQTVKSVGVQKGQSSSRDDRGTASDKTFGPSTKGNKSTKPSLSDVSSSPRKATASSQTAHSSVAKGNDSTSHRTNGGVKSGDSGAGKSVIYAKPVSSLPRPGSAVNSNPGSPDPSKIRNLNYTPTKPYSEVMNPPLTPPPKSQVVTSKPPISGMSKTQQTPTSTTQTGTGSTTSTKMSSDNKRSSQQASSSNSGTLYYKKGSKAEEVLHEQRPPAVGAPARVSKMREKGSASTVTGDEDSENDEEDGSEPSFPSGERLPGDGEASLDEFEDDDEDDFEEDDYVASDGESDGYSFTSSLSRQSSSARNRFKSRPFSSGSVEQVSTSRPATASPEKVTRPSLTQSHFSNIPPTITFVGEGEKVDTLPWDLRKFLKWRISPITPNVVKNALSRIGFRITKRNHDWLGCWGKHMKSPGFKALREYQKLNHFPGSFQIGRKDKLWRNLSKMQVHFGKKEFSFFPQTYCLPYDSKLLKRAWEDGGTKQKWIIKPPASARGIGIKVINKWTQIPRRKPVIVQKYLARPYLINDSKFDLRIYVYVSSYDPLRLYVYEDGLARFASMKYSSSMKNLGNKFMHLTNYSVNKRNSDYQANTDENVCQGHKWSLKALWNYMKRQGINTSAVWENIKDLIIKTIICADGPINSMIKANCKTRYCCHELFGFDILLDESLKPWILEVNISPSLHSNSQLDVNIKGGMIKDLFNIAGFRIPDKHDVAHSHPKESPSDARPVSAFSGVGSELSDSDSEGYLDATHDLYVPPNEYCMDKRLFSQQMSPDERAKHAYYSQRHQDEQALQTILDTLTPDDVRVLCDSIDEDSRKGQFQRVFPTPSTHKYLRYFETARYNNLLLDQWVQRYNRMEQRGIGLLESLCDEGVHLELGSDNPAHQWNPPNATCHSYREPRLLSAPLSKHKEAEQTVKSSNATSSYSSQLPKMSKKQPKVAAVQRTLSQSSSASSINTLVLSPQPVQVVTPRGRAGVSTR